MADKTRANPGYRAFFANGENVTRTLALVVAEVWIELWPPPGSGGGTSCRAGTAGGVYPLLRAAMCVPYGIWSPTPSSPT